jgi:ribosomal protein S18 acetylase RimI-like enzyme
VTLPVADLPPARAEEAAAVLARAFLADPAWAWALPDDRRRARVLPWFFRAAVGYALRHGEVLATEGPVTGAAIVLPPARPLLDGRKLFAAGLWQMPLRAGPRGFARFVVQGRVLDERHARDVAPRHGYVWLIGVAEGQRGRGIGSAVLRAVSARRDAEGVPTYLDTTNERNLGFYGRHGFSVVHAGVFPRGGCRYWTLVRPPAR